MRQMLFARIKCSSSSPWQCVGVLPKGFAGQCKLRAALRPLACQAQKHLLKFPKLPAYLRTGREKTAPRTGLCITPGGYSFLCSQAHTGTKPSPHGHILPHLTPTKTAPPGAPPGVPPEACTLSAGSKLHLLWTALEGGLIPFLCPSWQSASQALWPSGFQSDGSERHQQDHWRSGGQ